MSWLLIFLNSFYAIKRWKLTADLDLLVVLGFLGQWKLMDHFLASATGFCWGKEPALFPLLHRHGLLLTCLTRRERRKSSLSLFPMGFSRSIEPIDEKRTQCKRIKRCEEPQMAAGGPVDMVISSRQTNAYLGRDHAPLALETFKWNEQVITF